MARATIGELCKNLNTYDVPEKDGDVYQALLQNIDFVTDSCQCVTSFIGA